MEPTYMPEGTPNATDYDEPLYYNYCEMEDLGRFSGLFTSILYSLILLLSVVGNSLVLWIVVKYENSTSLTNLFIMNLCITNLAFSCTLPFWIVNSYKWIGGDFLCKTVSAIFSINYYAGVIFITMMTIIRYLAVKNPLSTLRTQTKRCGILLSLLIWVTSILIAIPDFLFTKVNEEMHCEYQDFTLKWLELGLKVTFFLLPFIIIAICYTRMLVILLSSRHQRRHRTVKLIFAIVLVFFLSWAPFNMLGIIYILADQHFIIVSCQQKRDMYVAFDISRTIAFCHCCVNPVLYVLVGVKFRRHLKLLCKCFCASHGRVSLSSARIHSSMDHYDDSSMY